MREFDFRHGVEVALRVLALSFLANNVPSNGFVMTEQP